MPLSISPASLEGGSAPNRPVRTAPIPARPWATAWLAGLLAAAGMVAQQPQATTPVAAAPEPPRVAAIEEIEHPLLEGVEVRGKAPQAVYQTWITASYDPGERRILGSQRLTWRNTASVPVSALCFHHYLNAFSSNRTTFMRESGGQLRGDRFEGKHWGWIEASSVRLPDGTDLKLVESLTAPDDGNPDDRTVVRYPLPEAVPPGGSITVDIDFESRLPSIFARTGAEGDYVLGGQWFPKIGVFEDAGDRGREEPGWNCHQYHANSEFFADFGDYDVTLTLPARYKGKIGATGSLVEETEEGDQVRARFVQRGVHDFAWTADPRFEVVRATFDPTTDVPAQMQQRIAGLLGLPASELDLYPVDITLLVQPSHLPQQERYLQAAKVAIRGYGLHLGAYPYATLTLVDPPKDGLGSGGMEYPTFITLGTHAVFEVPPFHRILAPEMVTIHEFGHQFFQGMIASNEFEESWIDEGINSYYEMVVLEEEYPPPMRFLGLSVSSFESHRARTLSGKPYTDPIVTPSWGFLTGMSYGLNSYSRTAVSLRHLENLLGPEVFHRSMRRFFQQYQWGHPTTSDFQRTLLDASGRDLSWFFRQAFHSTRTLDYEVRSATSRRLRRERGVLWRDGERVEPPEEEEDEGGPWWRRLGNKEKGEEDEDSDLPYRSRAVVFRRGEFVHPVMVEFRFEDGTALHREWSGVRRWIRWTFTASSRLASVEVDPDGILALDANRLNNSLRVEPERLPRVKLLTDLLFWLQALFAGGGLFA